MIHHNQSHDNMHSWEIVCSVLAENSNYTTLCRISTYTAKIFPTRITAGNFFPEKKPSEGLVILIHRYTVLSRDRPRFFDQVRHQTTYAYIGNKHFFTKMCHHQTYPNSKISWQKKPISDFQSEFSMSKIIWIFLHFFSLKNINLGACFLLLTFSDNIKF